MANIDKPKGLVPLRVDSGNASAEVYKMKSGYNTALAMGDPVVRLADGTIGKAGVSSKGIIGAVDGFEYINSSGKRVVDNEWTAGTTTEGGVDVDVTVYDKPGQRFEIQADGTLGQTNIGNNASFVFGSVQQDGMSGAELDASTAATDASGNLPLKIVAVTDSDDNNDVSSANANWVVLINNHGNGSANAAGV